MFCGEITTNRRRLYRFRVFRIADLKTSQTKRFRGKFAKHGNKKNNSFRNIISYNSANAGEMSGPEMSVIAREPNPQFLVNLHSDAVKGCDTSM